MLEHFKLQDHTIPPSTLKDEPNTFELCIVIVILDLDSKSNSQSCLGV
jgi:hypothetical protein